MQAAIPPTRTFEGLTVILPVLNETQSLRGTIETLEAELAACPHDYCIVVCDRTTPQSGAVVEALRAAHGESIRVLRQKRPFLGGAMRDAFDAARASHVVMMASDLETDPATVKAMVEAARRRPGAVVTASRWRRGGGFSNYDPIKLLANRLFQKLFSLLYATRLTDMTFGFRLFPTNLVQAIAWEELRHPFLFETILKPLRLGVPVIELPSAWKARTEGTSSNTFLANFMYFRTGLRIRFMDKRRILLVDCAQGSGKE